MANIDLNPFFEEIQVTQAAPRDRPHILLGTPLIVPFECTSINISFTTSEAAGLSDTIYISDGNTVAKIVNIEPKSRFTNFPEE